MLHDHVVVWIDHHEAHVQSFTRDESDSAHEVLVVGPAQAKHELVKYLQHHMPQLAKKVIGVETVDHPTDGQLLEHARRFFRAADRMLP